MFQEKEAKDNLGKQTSKFNHAKDSTWLASGHHFLISFMEHNLTLIASSTLLYLVGNLIILRLQLNKRRADTVGRFRPGHNKIMRNYSVHMWKKLQVMDWFMKHNLTLIALSTLLYRVGNLIILRIQLNKKKGSHCSGLRLYHNKIM
jgi:hypothetical protein